MELKAILNRPPEFCAYCGGRMRLQPKRRNGWDPDTGEPRYRAVIKCERDRWWRWLSMHKEYMLTHDGELLELLERL